MRNWVYQVWSEGVVVMVPAPEVWPASPRRGWSIDVYKRQVLLMLVCLGMGPEAGVAGLCVHTTAFFTKSFAQSFESIPDETIEALEVTGAGRLSIFCNAILPAALSQIVAWAGMRLETNFSECAILGMVGAGGIGYVISNSLQGYDYGTAGVAILLVFLVAYCIERVFVRIKKKFY